MTTSKNTEIVRSAPVLQAEFDDNLDTSGPATQWSPYQLAVFDNIARGFGHTVVKAVAGSGKTTTIVEALSYVPAGMSVLFVAFNKSIAEELKKRAPAGVEVSTLHSYGLRTITRSLGRLRIENNRVHGLINQMRAKGQLELSRVLEQILANIVVSEENNRERGEFAFELQRDLAKVVSLAKGALAADENDIEELIESFEIEAPKRSPLPDLILPKTMQEAFYKAFVKDALAVLIRCSDVSDGCIDFDDMIWLPVVLDLRQNTFDRVFVDETQDLNPCQIKLTMRAVKAGGRICAVGDPRQAIYRFRGADEAAVDNIVTSLKATVLPLSVCYRCSKAVVELAKTVVPEIEWAPGAADGMVTDASVAEMKKNARPGQFILSRSNAPLVSLCMYFLKEGRPATIQGRDIGATLATFVKKSAARSVTELCDYVETWRETECARLAAKRRDTQAVEDRAECILAIADGAPSVLEVISRIEKLFADKDDSSRIVLSSTHKAKGMERDVVWMLESTYCRRPGMEEQNLFYVGVTRARKTLHMVQGDFGKKHGDK